jgi:hypothetical protein
VAVGTDIPLLPGPGRALGADAKELESVVENLGAGISDMRRGISKLAAKLAALDPTDAAGVRAGRSDSREDAASREHRQAVSSVVASRMPTLMPAAGLDEGRAAIVAGSPPSPIEMPCTEQSAARRSDSDALV